MRMKVWMEIKKFNELEFYFLFMNFSSYANLKIKWPLQIFFCFLQASFCYKNFAVFHCSPETYARHRRRYW